MAHVTTTDVFNVYEQYAIDLLIADASAIADDTNREAGSREQAIELLHGNAQMARAAFDDRTYEACRFAAEYE
jgi:hypothetical protein